MKKILTIIAALAIASSAFAQLPEGLTVGAGVTITPLTYSTEGAAEGAPSSLSGINVFAEYEYKATQTSGISLGVRYVLAGLMYDEKMTVGMETAEIKYAWNNIQIPVKYVAHLGDFYVSAGPTFDYWTKCTMRVTQSSQTVEENLFNKHSADEMNRFNINLGAEAGYDFQDHIRVFIGYDYTTKPLIQYTKMGEDWTAKKSEIRLGVGYKF